MSKNYLRVALASAIFASSSIATAYNDFELRPYAGVEYRLSTNQGNVVNDGFGSDILKDHVNSMVLITGVQLNEFLGVETSLSHNIVNLAENDNMDARISSIGLGLTAQYPLTDYIYAKAMLGASWGRLDIKENGTKIHYTSNAEFAAKLGLGYIIDDQNVLEFTYSYALNSDGAAVHYKHFF